MWAMARRNGEVGTGRRRRVAAFAGVLALAGVSLGGCGGDAGDAAPPATVKMGEFYFAPAELTVPRDATVLLRNNGAEAHSWVVQGPGVGTAPIQPRRSFVLTLKGIKPGRYPVYCDQMGHAAAGQKGTLIIT